MLKYLKETSIANSGKRKKPHRHSETKEIECMAFAFHQNDRSEMKEIFALHRNQG